jgi:hypothetical protein
MNREKNLAVRVRTDLGLSVEEFTLLCGGVTKSHVILHESGGVYRQEFGGLFYELLAFSRANVQFLLKRSIKKAEEEKDFTLLAELGRIAQKLTAYKVI